MKKLILGLAAAGAFAGTAAVAAPPRVFLHDAALSNNSEIALGRLLEQRGGSDKSRDVGRMLQRPGDIERGRRAAAAAL